MKHVVSKQALEVIRGEVAYHKDMGYDQPQGAEGQGGDADGPERPDVRSLAWMLVSVFVFRFLSALLILAGLFCLLAALAHVHADSIIQTHPTAAPHLEVLATIVDRILDLRQE